MKQIPSNTPKRKPPLAFSMPSGQRERIRWTVDRYCQIEAYRREVLHG